MPDGEAQIELRISAGLTSPGKPPTPHSPGLKISRGQSPRVSFPPFPLNALCSVSSTPRTSAPYLAAVCYRILDAGRCRILAIDRCRIPDASSTPPSSASPWPTRSSRPPHRGRGTSRRCRRAEAPRAVAGAPQVAVALDKQRRRPPPLPGRRDCTLRHRRAEAPRAVAGAPRVATALNNQRRRPLPLPGRREDAGRRIRGDLAPPPPLLWGGHRRTSRHRL
jgi:hypothetical protein